MKKIILLFILVFSINVYAKDDVYTISKNVDEKYLFIEKSYNEKSVVDGMLLVGRCGIDDSSDYQLMVTKYNKVGEVIFNYYYKTIEEDSLKYIDYSYNDLGVVDGYIIVLKNSFLKLGLDGKEVYEKDSGNDSFDAVKMLAVSNEEGIYDGYVLSFYKKDGNKSLLVKYDREFNIIDKREVDYKITDITYVNDNNNHVGFIILKENIIDEMVKKYLVRYNMSFNDEVVISESLDNYSVVKLEKNDNGFILYGITDEVKVDNGDESYFLINYNINNEIEWETYGDVPVIDNIISLLSLDDEYYLLYNNSIDNSIQVVKFDKNGMFLKKLKKINSDYYRMENFLTYKNVLYFIGQVNCLDDLNCVNDKSSLFIISDVDKVIEVKDKDSKNIIIVFVVLIVGVILTSFIRNKYLKKNLLSK